MNGTTAVGSKRQHHKKALSMPYRRPSSALDAAFHTVVGLHLMVTFA